MPVRVGSTTSTQVEEVAPSRILPHAFYDQAVASIPSLYPDGEILASTRFGQFKDIDYAYVAYRINSQTESIRMTMMATEHRRAWRHTSEATLEAIDEQLESFLDQLVQLSAQGQEDDMCTQYPYPEPSVTLPAEPPSAGIYEQLSIFDLDLNLGLAGR